MPVVTIHALRPPEAERIDMSLSAAVDAVSTALGTSSQSVWAHFVPSEAMHTGQRPRGYSGHCPVVEICALAGRPDDAIAAALEATANSVAAALDLPPEDVWVRYTELTPGRVWSGGGLRT